MTKMGKLIGVGHQLCLAHGIQLAVIKVLYQKITPQNVFTEQLENTEVDKDAADSELYSSDGSDDEDGVDDDGLQIIVNSEYENNLSSNIVLHSKIYPLVDKIRKMVKIFRRSPTKNDSVLQKYIKEQFNKEIQLKLDSKTRWNSLFDMLERFQLVKDCVRKSLIDIKHAINFSDEEFELLSTLILSMDPLKVAVEKLCCQDTNLFTADIAIKFLLDELSAQNSFLSAAFKSELINHISARRTTYSDLFYYLNNPKYLQLESTEITYSIFNKTSRGAILKLIVELVERLCDEERTQNNDTEEVEPIAIQPELSESLSLKDKLNMAIKQQSCVDIEGEPQQRTSREIIKIIRREMTYFDDMKIRGKYLQRVFNYLNSIRPTSVESERAFSAAGLFCTKIRSRLNDQSLNALCFLRAFFLQEELL